MSSKAFYISSYNNSSSQNNVLQLNLPFPVEFKNEEVCLAYLSLYYSWFNISSFFGNNTLSYIFNGQTRNITIPDGFYLISDINAYIQLQMYNNGDYTLDENSNPIYFMSIVSNSSYYCCTLNCLPITLPSGGSNPHNITLSGNVPQLVVNNAAFGELIGFSTGTYPSSTQSSSYQVNGTLVPEISPQNNVVVNCNLVNNSKINIFPNTLYVFSPNVEFLSLIELQPPQLIYLPIIDGIYSSITVTLTDQNYRQLFNQDPNITCFLVTRKRQ